MLELLLPEEAGGGDGGGALFREVEIGREEVRAYIPTNLHVLRLTAVLFQWVSGFNSQVSDVTFIMPFLSKCADQIEPLVPITTLL